MAVGLATVAVFDLDGNLVEKIEPTFRVSRVRFL
jgi:hypothetical protein